MAELATRVQALPAELFNRILDYTTLSCEDDEVDLEHGPFTFPIGFQINRITRRAAMQVYYSNTVFRFDDWIIGASWLLSMTATQRRLLRHLYYLWDDAFQRLFKTTEEALIEVHERFRVVACRLADVIYINVNMVEPLNWRNREELSRIL